MKLEKRDIKSILLKGYYGFGNFGDDLLMLVSYRLLQSHFPEAKLSIFSNFNERLQGFNRPSNYNHYIFNILKCEAKLIDWTCEAHYDLIVNGGGGVFFDKSHGGYIFTMLNFVFAKLGIKRVNGLDRWIRRLLKKPNRLTADIRIGLGIGIGPYTGDSKLFVRHMAMLGDFNILGVRDQKSVSFLIDHQFQGTQMSFTDLAFLTEYWRPKGFFQKEKIYSRKLGIVLQDFPEGNLEKLGVVKQFVNELNGVDVTFFSFDQNHDRVYAKEFTTFNLQVWQPDKNEMIEFLELLGSMNIVISARAHGVIISALLGVVPICLGVSQKLIEVSKYFPKGGRLIEEPFNVTELTRCFYEVVLNYSQHQSFLLEESNSNSVEALKAREKLFSK